MAGVDSRIVTMKFDNSGFERGVGTTLSMLEKLKQALTFSGASKGLSDLQATGNKFNLLSMEGAVTDISKAWVAMSTIAITALANITNRAVDAGLQFAKSFTIDPIKQGLAEYNTTLNSIQTVLANTGLSGKKGLERVNGALQELNTYSDKTIYNFTQMAKNIGTFTAAGVNLKTSTAAIKGIANLAAVSGSSADQASTAMYQLSQALAAGRVSLMDWNSVVNAGMGGKVFQQALMETARVHHVAVDEMVKDAGSFRNSLQKGWLTTPILTETLSKFTGDLTADQLKAMGYNEKQIKGIIKMGKVAQDAATKVKTLPQLVNTLQEAIGSGWTKTFQLIFGNIDEAKTTFTAVSNVLGGMIQVSAKSRNKVLSDWKAMGGRTVLIEAISNAFHALLDIIKPIREAFRDIFPAMTGKRLYDLTVSLRNFTESLKISDDTSNGLKRTFRGVFAVVDIIKQVLGGAIGVFKDLFGVVSEGSGGFLDFTGGIGDFLVSVDEALKKGEGLTNFFAGISGVLAVPIRLIQALAGFISDLFSGFDNSSADGVVGSLGAIGEKLSPLQALAERVRQAFSGLSFIFGGIARALQPIAKVVEKALGGITTALQDAFSGGNFNKTLDAINTGLLAGIVLLFRKFVNNGLKGIFGGGRGGLVGSVVNAFNGLTGTLRAMQTNIQASTLLKIAGAVALLTVSVVALSLIDSAKLTKALAAMSVGFTQLLAAMAVLVKISGSAGFIKVPIIASSMVLLAGAIVVLTIAVRNLSSLNWEELTKGLLGVAGLMTIMSAGAGTLSRSSAGMISAGVGMIGIAIALKILASAVKDFSSMNWAQIGKGLTAVAGALIAISIGMQMMPVTLPITGAGLILVAAGLKVLASALSDFGNIDWKTMGRGMVGLAGALLIIAGAMQLMPPNMIASAAGLLIVSAALQLIQKAVANMGAMSWEEIGKGLVTLAGALAILAGGLYLMTGTLGGSAALLVASAALAVLTPVLVVLGSMSWEGIAKGMVTLGGAFTILGIAGLLLAPVTPIIIGLGVALLAIGAGLALAGAGTLAFATAMGILATAGGAGAIAITAILGAIIGSIPKAMKAFGQGLIAFAGAIAKGGPTFVHAFVTVLDSLLNAIIKVTPKIGHAFIVMMHTALSVLRSTVPDMVSTGFQLLMAFLRGIESNIGRIVRVVTQIIVNFITALGNQLPKILDAGAKFIIKFINGLADAIDNNSEALGEAGGRLAVAIIQGMVKGLAGGVSVVADAAKNVAKSALDSAKHFLGVSSPSKEFEKIGHYVDQGFAKGLVGGLGDVKFALGKLKAMLSTEMQSIDAAISTQKAKLDQLRAEKHPDNSAITKAQQTLKSLEDLRTRAANARHRMNTDLKDEEEHLKRLGKHYDELTNKLNKAKDKLAAARKERDDFAQSITDQFSQGPEIKRNTDLVTYEKSLEQQIADTKHFKETLDKLRKMGLSDEAYKELLAKGPDVQPFLDQLVSGGSDAVDQFDNLQSQLDDAASALGDDASKQLYQAGVDAARGLVEGLKKNRDKIAHEMRIIAREMVRAIKHELKIKSPSEIMAEVGKFTNEGLAEGLNQYSHVVDRAAVTMANSALDTIKKTMSGISDTVSGEINMSPVVAPVLDLTSVQKDAAAMNKIISAEMQATASYQNAAAISAAQAKIAETKANTSDVPASQTVLEFNQNNYSPKALSPIDIYRQTKNQLSLAKEAVKG